MKWQSSTLANRVAATFLLATAVGAMGLVACGPKLPDPESEPAQLYTKYCSGSGCHDPIPPQVDSKGYWDNQYQRMIVLMRDKGMAVPNAREDAMIREYLRTNASQ